MERELINMSYDYYVCYTGTRGWKKLVCITEWDVREKFCQVLARGASVSLIHYTFDSHITIAHIYVAPEESVALPNFEGISMYCNGYVF